MDSRYVISGTAEDSRLSIPRESRSKTLDPSGFGTQIREDSNEVFTLLLGSADADFTFDGSNWTVTFIGEIDDDVATEVVSIVARQIENCLGLETRWTRIG
jgi:hypothetical protein